MGLEQWGLGCWGKNLGLGLLLVGIEAGHFSLNSKLKKVFLEQFSCSHQFRRESFEGILVSGNEYSSPKTRTKHRLPTGMEFSFPGML